MKLHTKDTRQRRAGQSRTRRAVERTVPFALWCYTITIVWYTLHGHHPSDVAERRTRSPWYVTKSEPSFADMAAKLRSVMIAARFSVTDPGRPTSDEIHAVQHAWAAASVNTTPSPTRTAKVGRSVGERKTPVVNLRVLRPARRDMPVLA